MLKPIKLPESNELYDSAWVIIEITKTINDMTWNEAGRKRGIQRINRIIKDWETAPKPLTSSAGTDGADKEPQ